MLFFHDFNFIILNFHNHPLLHLHHFIIVLLIIKLSKVSLLLYLFHQLFQKLIQNLTIHLQLVLFLLYMLLQLSLIFLLSDLFMQLIHFKYLINNKNNLSNIEQNYIHNLHIFQKLLLHLIYDQIRMILFFLIHNIIVLIIF